MGKTEAVMTDARTALHRMTRAAWHGIRMAGQNRPQLSIPPQPGDDDMVLAAVIDERDELRVPLVALQANWERLCRCVDEFEPDDPHACEERRQDLYGAIEAVLTAWRG